MRPPVSRRSVLGAGLAVTALSACRHRPSAPPVPGATALDSAVADEDRLISGYDALLAVAGGSGGPAVAAIARRLRADHVAHRDALLRAGARPGPSPAPSVTSSPTPGPLGRAGVTAAELAAAKLAAAERRAADARTEACLGASEALAPLFASLAASEAAHALALGS